ncbi:MAG: DUF362 domain-containing protein, partial [Candidatus Hodarchaeota archaeon]
KRSLVKPNMLRSANPDDCVITDPRLLRATVAFLLQSGAEVVVGDNPMPDSKNMNELEVAQSCGFTDAAMGRFRNIGRYSKRIVRKGNLLRELYVSREVLDCDLLISLPKFKTHELTAMTIAIKNHFGIIPGGQKPFIHSLFPKINDFSKVLLEIYQTRPPEIIIVDCLNVVDARGKKFSPGRLIAGDNGHAVDYTCALMAGVNPYHIPTVRIARDEKMFSPDNIEYRGAVKKIDGYTLPFTFPMRNTIVEFFARFFYQILLKRVPVINHARCTRCFSCENVCPPMAIRKQQIDYGACIKCYCCMEICPNQALRIKYKMI